MDYSAPGSSDHVISQQECWSWVAIFRLGIFPTQGLSPSLLYWQVDSLPLSHEGSPECCLVTLKFQDRLDTLL